MPTLVFVPGPQADPRDWPQRLEQDAPGWTAVVPGASPGAVAAALAGADAAFGTLTPELLAAAPRLRWLQAPAANPPEGFFFPALVEHPVQVTNFAGIYDDHIGTHVMACLLSLARRLDVYAAQQARHEWRPSGTDADVLHLPGATALVVGVGGIGSEVARLCAAFGMQVLGVDARRTQAPPGMAELHGPQSLDELLGRADVVVNAVPHTPATVGLFDAGRFARFRQGALYVTIGRGATTSLDALVAALATGHLGGAALDVAETEPLPAGHPLWDAPRTIITPHVAGYGPHLDERRYAVLVDGARRLAAGEPLRDPVDKASWF